MFSLFAKTIIFAGIFSAAITGLTIVLKRLNRHNSRSNQGQKFLVDKAKFDDHILDRAMDFYTPPGFISIETKRSASKPFSFHKSLNRFVDIFLNNPSGFKYLLISGSPGSGKTNFVINFYLRRYRQAAGPTENIFIVPMKLKNAWDMISALPDKSSTLLILDGLDENTALFENPISKLIELIEITRDFYRIIMTCESGFIPQADNRKTRPGFKVIGCPDREKNHFYEIKEVFLQHPTGPEIKKRIESNRPFWEKSISNDLLHHFKKHPRIKLSNLALSYLGPIFPDHIGITSNFELYKEIIEKSFSFETHWKARPAFMKFIYFTAVDFFNHRVSRQEESMEISELEKACAASGIEYFPLSSHKHSIIYQNQGGKIWFSHRSFMEFLYIRQLMDGNEACFKEILTQNMKSFLISKLSENLSKELKTELSWLLTKRFRAQAVRPDIASREKSPFNLFESLAQQKKEYCFLLKLTQLINNPIFYEFGWDPQLLESLENSISKGETALLKLSRPRRTVFIDSKHLEITTVNQHKYRVLINKTNVEQYNRIKKEKALIMLNRAIYLKGLKMLNKINLSGEMALLPDLQSPGIFTLYFLKEKQV